MVGWSDLPEEIIYAIAERCNINSLGRLVQVDRRTHRVCLDGRLWKRQSFLMVGARTSCRAGPACIQEAASIYGWDVASRVREWLASHARPWMAAYARGGKVATESVPPPPWLWTRFLVASESLGCACHWPRSDAPDYRWVCASMASRPVFYYGPGDAVPRRVGRSVGRPVGETTSIEAFDWAYHGDRAHPACAYSGDMDADGEPHGWGTLVIGDDQYGVLAETVSGQWAHGKAHGHVRAWSNSACGMFYYEGNCVKGRPEGRGIAINHYSVYDGEWSDGGQVGEGISCSNRRLQRYGSLRGAAALNAVELRPDGTVAREYRLYGPNDDDDDDDDNYDDDDSISDKEQDDERDCDAEDPAGAVGGPNEGDHVMRDRAGAVIYRGPLVHGCWPKANTGTAYLADGTAVTHTGRTIAVARRRVTVTYPSGDAVSCVVPSKARDSPPKVLEFVVSPRATSSMAGRVFVGPWHVLATPRPIVQPPPEQQGVKQADPPPCPPDGAITELASDPPPSDVPERTRSVGDFIFWPVARGPDREAFFDHMIRHNGDRWATCRAVADAMPW